MLQFGSPTLRNSVHQAAFVKHWGVVQRQHPDFGRLSWFQSGRPSKKNGGWKTGQAFLGMGIEARLFVLKSSYAVRTVIWQPDRGAHAFKNYLSHAPLLGRPMLQYRRRPPGYRDEAGDHLAMRQTPFT
jgi:hypothetical protein